MAIAVTLSTVLPSLVPAAAPLNIAIAYMCVVRRGHLASGRKKRIASTKLGWGVGFFSARMEEGSWVGGTLEALSSSLSLQNHQGPTLILATGFAGRYSHYSDLSEAPSLPFYNWAFG